MKKAQLDDMFKGWFVGDFNPTAFSTNQCEVAVKTYKEGDSDAAHYHKLAHEITLVLNGTVSMLDQTWQSGDIVVIEPGEVSSFTALTDATLVVVKVPGAKDDKYLAD
jgi:quercetin dioxygenase-like cupin family protein